jgi:hypothetical protein
VVSSQSEHPSSFSNSSPRPFQNYKKKLSDSFYFLTCMVQRPQIKSQMTSVTSWRHQERNQKVPGRPGDLWKKLSSPFNHPNFTSRNSIFETYSIWGKVDNLWHFISLWFNSSSANPFSSSRNSLWETPGDKPEGSRAGWVVEATPEPSSFSPGVSQRELRELEKVGRIRDET